MPTLNWIGKEAAVRHHKGVPFRLLEPLPDHFLAVEYKGADRWAGAEDDRLIGGLWANLSGGRCRFVMVKDKRWERIEEKLSPSLVRPN